MSNLKPCPFCGGEAEIHPSNDWDAKFTGSTYFAWCDKCETRGDYYNTEAEAIVAWNTRADDAPDQTVDSCEADSREQLEWDAKMLVDNLRFYGFHYADDPKQEIIELLDRQATITEREIRTIRCFACNWADERAELTAECDELKAEVEAQRKRANDAERGVLSEEWYVCRDRYEDDIAELTAERDKLKRRLENQAAYIAGVEANLCRYESQLVRDVKDIDKLTAELDELKAAIAAIKHDFC